MLTSSVFTMKESSNQRNLKVKLSKVELWVNRPQSIFKINLNYSLHLKKKANKFQLLKHQNLLMFPIDIDNSIEVAWFQVRGCRPSACSIDKKLEFSGNLWTICRFDQRICLKFHSCCPSACSVDKKLKFSGNLWTICRFDQIIFLKFHSCCPSACSVFWKPFNEVILIILQHPDFTDLTNDISIEEDLLLLHHHPHHVSFVQVLSAWSIDSQTLIALKKQAMRHS